ncbi:T9SS type A sorting domain-containing protein [Myroides odoratimimus]|uniref:T9SS type A sorting domain-containing protein n=1 Tax=Myroides odoratimimus TaxID=76832 RepID=UPI003100B2E5
MNSKITFKKKSVFIITLLCSSINCFSQKVLWEKTIGGNNSEFLFDLKPTLDNGFLLAGTTQSNKSGDISKQRIGNYDAWLWKMKASGKKEWEMRIGGDGDNYLKSIDFTKEDGGYILGLTSSSTKDIFKEKDLIGKADAWIIKLDAARNVLWQTTLGGSESEDLVKLLPLAGGDYIALINSNSIEGGNKTEPYFGGQDIWVVRINSQGTIKWQRSFGGEYDDIASDIISTSDKGFLIGGYSNSGISGNKTSEAFGNNDYWVIKISSDGKELWQKSYGAEGNDQLKQIQEVNKDSYRVYGISDSNAGIAKNSSLESEIDYWILELDTQGEVVQEISYGYGVKNYLSNAYINEKGDMFLGGTTQEKTSQDTKVSYLGTLLDKEGYVIWEKSISGRGENVLSKFIETRDGAYVFAGTSDSGKSREKSSHRGMNDFWFVKLKAKSSEDNTKDEKSEDVNDLEKPKLEAVPNPVVTYTNIIIPTEYNIGVLKLYDLSGRLLHQQVIKHQTEAINLGGFPKGAYIISIKTDTMEGSINILKK